MLINNIINNYMTALSQKFCAWHVEHCCTLFLTPVGASKVKQSGFAKAKVNEVIE